MTEQNNCLINSILGRTVSPPNDPSTLFPTHQWNTASFRPESRPMPRSFPHSQIADRLRTASDLLLPRQNYYTSIPLYQPPLKTNQPLSEAMAVACSRASPLKAVSPSNRRSTHYYIFALKNLAFRVLEAARTESPRPLLLGDVERLTGKSFKLSNRSSRLSDRASTSHKCPEVGQRGKI